MMLRKAPAARPSLQRVVDLLRQLAEDPGPAGGAHGLGVLAQAGAHVAERQAAEEAEQRRIEAEREERVALAREASCVLREVTDRLQRAVLDAAPAARPLSHYGVGMGHGVLEIHPQEQRAPLAPATFSESGWDVIAGATIRVRQTGQPDDWSSSLWYADRRNGAGYRWYEISYFALGSRLQSSGPFAIDNPREADLASGPAMHVYAEAWGPTPIDDENAAAFCDRWAAVLARASRGQLRHPSRLPLSDDDWYRG